MDKKLLKELLETACKEGKETALSVHKHVSELKGNKRDNVLVALQTVAVMLRTQGFTLEDSCSLATECFSAAHEVIQKRKKETLAN